MPVSIVVGGQFGSEGKGKVTSILASELEADAIVRCGGPNAGHTDCNGRVYRHLPCIGNSNADSYLSAGSYIDLDVLSKEYDGRRLFIDPYSMIITKNHKEREIALSKLIGSTGSGTGAALLDRVSRSKDIVFAKDVSELHPYITNVKEDLYLKLTKGNRIIIEGTQGFGLSLLHSGEHPKVTSRDTTAAGFLSEIGLSPLFVDEVVLVLRAFPIRVAGDSGRLPNEISWEDLGIKAERTTVTKNIRRVGLLDKKVIREAIISNSPTSIVMNHVDYVPIDSRNKWLDKVETSIGVPINYIGLNSRTITPR